MNLATIGKLYRDGLIDSFMARAIIDNETAKLGYESRISDRRFQMFLYRWGVMNGSIRDSQDGLWWMRQAERKLWNRCPTAVLCSDSLYVSWRRVRKQKAA